MYGLLGHDAVAERACLRGTGQVEVVGGVPARGRPMSHSTNGGASTGRPCRPGRVRGGAACDEFPAVRGGRVLVPVHRPWFTVGGAASVRCAGGCHRHSPPSASGSWARVWRRQWRPRAVSALPSSLSARGIPRCRRSRAAWAGVVECPRGTGLLCRDAAEIPSEEPSCAIGVGNRTPHTRGKTATKPPCVAAQHVFSVGDEHAGAVGKGPAAVVHTALRVRRRRRREQLQRSDHRVDRGVQVHLVPAGTPADQIGRTARLTVAALRDAA